MSSRTRVDASSFSGVSLPRICVFTGPAAGNVSMMPSLWKRTTDSVNMGWNTPQAPCHGSVRSSYFKPRSFRPSTYVCIHSLRSPMSFVNSLTSSLPKDSSALVSMYSARLASKSSSESSGAGARSISISPKPILTDSGSSISISIGSISSSSIPRGAAYKPLSMLI